MSIYGCIKNYPIKTVRKQHRCSWCGQAINKGEPAQYRYYVFDGPTSEWQHPECYAAMNDCEEDISDGWMPGDFPRGSAVSWDNMTEEEREDALAARETRTANVI